MNNSTVETGSTDVYNISNFMSNHTEEATDGLHFPELDGSFLSAFFVLSGVLGVILNVLTISAIALGKHVSESMKIQLINLAVADCIMAGFYPANALDLDFHGEVTWCAIYHLIVYSAMYASILCNAAISLERFVIIYFPFKAAGYGKIQKLIVVGIIWLCSILPEIFDACFAHLKNLKCDSGPVWAEEEYRWIFSAKYLPPVTVIVVSYTLVFIKLCMRKRSNIVHRSSSQENNSMNKLLMMLVVDAFVTVATWVPYTVTELSIPPTDESDRAKFLNILNISFHALLGTNAFSTPIIYFIFNRHFRMDVRLLFLRMRRCKTPAAAPAMELVRARRVQHTLPPAVVNPTMECLLSPAGTSTDNRNVQSSTRLNTGKTKQAMYNKQCTTSNEQQITLKGTTKQEMLNKQ